jgi:hypothetical protein
VGTSESEVASLVEAQDGAVIAPTPRARRGPRRSRADIGLAGVPRSRTLATKKLTRTMLAAYGAELDDEDFAELDVSRPRTRADCIDGPRPCPFASCKHHLYLEVNSETGAIKLNVPHLEIEQLKHSCALDVADDGEHTLEEVGELLNVTRERVRQIELAGLHQLKAKRETPR